jgi:threonyl-tRNA synthetase
MKIPYLLVVGETEATNQTVNVRSYKDKTQTEIDVTDFVERLATEYREKVL